MKISECEACTYRGKKNPFGVPVELLDEFVESYRGKEIPDDLWDIVFAQRDKWDEEYHLTVEQKMQIGWSLFDHIYEIATVWCD